MKENEKVIIPVYKLEEQDEKVLVRIQVDKNLDSFDHVWIKKEKFLIYKDRYYIEGVINRKIGSNYVVVFDEFTGKFSMLINENMIERGN